MTPGTWSSTDERIDVWPGRSWPLGATWSEESTNFAVYSPAATALWVCLFDGDGHEVRHELTEHTLGINDLGAPDFGDPVEVREGETPVFWACGVTPQAAVMASRPDYAIGHAPGHMAVTDARDSDYLVP